MTKIGKLGFLLISRTASILDIIDFFLQLFALNQDITFFAMIFL